MALSLHLHFLFQDGNQGLLKQFNHISQRYRLIPEETQWKYGEFQRKKMEKPREAN